MDKKIIDMLKADFVSKDTKIVLAKFLIDIYKDEKIDDVAAKCINELYKTYKLYLTGC
jgi:hypothetical protein